MSNIKDLWYDWLGLNTWLFKKINSISGIPVYDEMMQFFSIFGDKKALPYILSILVIFAIMSFAARVILKKGGNRNYFFMWINIFLVIGAGLAANYYTVTYIKKQSAYPRPYVALPVEQVKLLEIQPAKEAYQSFPSGHVAIVTILVVALWPILGENPRWAGVLIIFGVAWSRMALGVHYPMDVISGFAISLFQMVIIRRILFAFYSVLNWIKRVVFRI